jgi:tight adherence protein C
MTVAASLAATGYFLPHFWLGSQIRARQKAIQRALPDTLDLLTVGVGAGLSLDGAILEVVEKSDNHLSHELASFLAELRMGRTRREALQGLQARTEVEDIKVLVASLIQAEELGMSLSETLLVQADQMRLRRRQRAEEMAHKATVKMLFPMVVLIFPALFIVIMGPAVPSFMAFTK